MRLNGISKEKFAEELSKLIYDCLARQGERRSQLFTDVMDTARSYELEEQALAMAHGICLKEGEPDLWELPKPFDNALSLPKLTERCLPPMLWEYLKAVANYVQVAPEMGVLPLLSVLSLCVQGKAVISNVETGINSHTEPLNIYTLTVAAPGERKSGCFKEFVRPIYEYQQAYNLTHKSDIERYITEKEFLKRQRDNSMKGQKPDKKKALELTKQLSELEEVHELKLIVEDTTPEALAAELSKQGEHIAILDSEGTVFDVLSGAYSSTTNIGIFLKGYDGEPYSVARKLSPDLMLTAPLLVMGLMVQPAHFSESMSNKQFSGRGFIHRFMFSFPESMFERSNYEGGAIDPKLRTMYSELVQSLLALPCPKGKPPIIFQSRESKLLFENYFDHLKVVQKKGGCFANLREWASKQLGRALRIAGNFHMIENCALTDPTSKPLSAKTAQYAIDFSLWQEAQAFHALSGEGSEGETVRNAKLILEKLKGLKVKEITKGELLSKTIRGFKASELQEPLDLLSDMNYIKIIEEKKGGAGKPKQVLQINPNI